MKLQFLGATETVTGSKFHLSNQTHSWLIDCGLYQGLKDLRRRNWHPFPVDLKALNAVMLTHAHIDHSGYIPIVVRDGFKGNVLASEPTVELCKILLPDAGYIQEEDAKFAAKKGFSKHEHPMALYTYQDAVNSLTSLKGVEDREWHNLSDEVRMMLRPAGHILGSRVINISVKEKHRKFNIMFAGDLGTYDSLISVDPGHVKSVNYLVLESTYGDKLHVEENVFDRFEKIINATIARGGKVIIPAFAVGRTQEVLFILRQLDEDGRLPNVPIYLNSPLAIDATDIYLKYAAEQSVFNDKVKAEGEKAFRPSKLVMVQDPEESKQLNALQEPAIILSSSGMMTGRKNSASSEGLSSRSEEHPCDDGISGGRNARAFDPRWCEGDQDSRHAGRGELTDRVCGLSLGARRSQTSILRWLRGFESPPKRPSSSTGSPMPAWVLSGASRKNSTGM